MPLAIACVAGSAEAQDTEDLLGILNEPVVTTASQSAEAASTAPATSTTITVDQLRKYGIHTVEEAIDFLAIGMSTSGGRSASGMSDLGSRGVFITGSPGHHILLLVDGHAINEPLFGTARFDHTLGIPLEAVDHIEVIVGPGSVLYGSSAMLGVVNIITKDASTLKGIHAVGETNMPVYHRGAVVAGSEFSLFGADAEVTTAAQYWYQYGPDFTVGPLDLGIDRVTERPTRPGRGLGETGIWQGTLDDSNFAKVPSGLLRLRVGDLEIALRARIAEWGRPFGLNDFDDPESKVIERNASGDITYRTLLTPKLRLSARLYGDLYDSKDTINVSAVGVCAYPDTQTCSGELIGVSRWGGTEIQTEYDWLGTGRLNTLVGFDGRARFVGSKQDTRDFDTGEPVDSSRGIVNETDPVFGAYLQQTYWPTTWLGLNGGARFDYDPRFSPVVSPRAAASLGTWDGGTLKLIYSQAFRAPTYEETTVGNILQARAVDLEPETVRSVEGSIEHRFGPHRVLFGAFYTWWTNIVEAQTLTFEQAVEAARQGLLEVAIPEARFFQYQNVSSLTSYGFNVALDGAFVEQRLRYGLNLTEAYARRDAPGLGSQALPVAPRLAANARVSYDLQAGLPTVGLASRLLSSRFVDRAFEFPSRPTATPQLELRATLTGDAVLPGLSYRISGDYLFGTRGPYAIGPIQFATATQREPELSPLPEWQVTLGLEYALFDD